MRLKVNNFLVSSLYHCDRDFFSTPNEAAEVRVCPSVCTFAHEFCHDVDGLLRHNGVERHQLVVSQFLHDLGLLQEGLWRHGARLQGLYGHFGCAIPSACITTTEQTFSR